jgi:hypothetical protein
MDKSESIPEKPLFPKREGFRLIFTFMILLMAAGPVLAQAGGPEDYNVEAAFLSNFGKFVQWPQNSFASQSAPIIIGVYGEDPFHDSLKDIVRSRTINGHPVLVQPVPFNKLQYCQVLFICPSERKNLPDIIRKLNGACVLTVTENIDPFHSGVMINFVRTNNQVRFEINDAAARRVGLKISSKLLSLATKTTMSRETPKQQALLCDRFP